jgi:hypothetical protein
MLDQHGQLLRAALGFAGLPRPSSNRALRALRTWLDSWPGIGHVAAGRHRQRFDLQLTQYDDRGWRATFYTTGMEHSPTSATGTAWERTPWHDAAGGVGGRWTARAAHNSGLLNFPPAIPSEVLMRRIGLAVALIISLLAFAVEAWGVGGLRLQRIDGWRTIAAAPGPHTAVAS